MTEKKQKKLPQIRVKAEELEANLESIVQTAEETLREAYKAYNRYYRYLERGMRIEHYFDPNTNRYYYRAHKKKCGFQ